MSSLVVSVDGEATLEEAVGAMLVNRVGNVLVTETGLWGILTRSDVLRALTANSGTFAEVDAKDAMSADVVTVNPRASVETALRLMAEHEIKKLPIITDFEVVESVTTTDIARY